jgi:hypothetical protein
MLRFRRPGPPVIAFAWAVLLLSSGAAQAAPTITFDAIPFGQVFVQGEAPVIDVTVTADAAGHRGRLVVLAIDAYGRRAGRLAQSIDLEPGTSTTTQLTLRPRGLGHFDIIASLSGKGAKVQAVTAAAIVPPILDTPAEASAVGYFVYPVDDEWTRADEIASQMRRLGVRWVRYGFHGWNDARPVAPDPSDPAWLDSTIFERWVDAFRGQGIEVLASVFGLPRWASSQPDDETPIVGLPRWAIVAPRDLDEWGAIMRTLAGRLAGKVRHWEVWNEPNHYLYWQSSAADFASLVRETATAVRDVDPTARIALGYAPSLYGPFEREVIETAGDEIDVFGWHYAQRANVEEGLALLPQLRPGAVVWDTEATGAPRRHVNRWLEERAAGAERIFPFVYRLPDYEEVTGLERFGRYPVNVDYSPRPDALALRTLSDAVGDAPSFVRAEAGVGYSTFTAPNGVTVLVDMNEGGITWLGAPGIDVSIEVPEAVKRLDATDLMGNQRSVRVRRGRARIRSYGIAEFLRADPPGALTSVRVTRVRPVKRR